MQNNLWGLDIDDRAAQLAYFAVMMKARQYDRRFFSKGVQPHVYAIQESNGINREHLNYLGRGLSDIERNNAVNQMNALLDEFIDAKEYGSILQPREYDWALLSRFVEDTTPMQQMSFGEAGLDATQAELRMMIAQGQALAQKYHAVVTNPPYMGSSGMGTVLSDYVKIAYPDSKSDLFAVFIERCWDMLAKNGYQAMITQHAWMFLSSFEKLRLKLMKIDVVSMAHLGARAFDEIGGEVVQTTTFVLNNRHVLDYKATYCRLVEASSEERKESSFLMGNQIYTTCQNHFSRIPGAPVAYWLTDRFIVNFGSKSVGDVYIPKFGMSTGDGEHFMRYWFEVSSADIDRSLLCEDDAKQPSLKWVPVDKGGTYRKWYGNRFNVVWWRNNGEEIKKYPKSAVRNPQYFFQKHISWTLISTGHFSTRYFENGFALDTASNCLYSKVDGFEYVLGLLNSVVADAYLAVLNPTMNFSCGIISLVPYLEQRRTTVHDIVNANIELSKGDWDSFETSWDFQRHPLAIPAIDQHYMRLADCWRDWEGSCDERFAQLKANEEELNRIFIDIYGLQDELTPEVDDKDVTVRRADLGRDIRSLISYAVGCMLGRYSLDKPGLAFAGGNWQEWLAQQDAVTYAPDKDGILPITDDEYFCDDIVMMFVDWVKTVYHDVLSERPSVLAKDCVRLSRTDWDSFETSWNFQRHPLVTPAIEQHYMRLADCWRDWERACNERFAQLKANEEELNRIFIDIYGLQDELTPEVDDKDVTVRKADLGRDIRSLISYAVGCMLGRYSLDKPGLAFAGGNWQEWLTQQDVTTYAPDKDGILPITDDEYFYDDIVTMFVDWLKTVYGAATLEENLTFIANALGGKGSPREVIREYFLNDFYKDHLKVYQKRPIYWLFDSGKKNGFKALVYMHRWQPDTIARVRTDYVHEMQSRYRTAIADVEQRINGASTSERVKLTKRLTALQAQAEELRLYEEKVHHLADQMIGIDLDDGVKVNYAKFADVMSPIK